MEGSSLILAKVFQFRHDDPMMWLFVFCLFVISAVVLAIISNNEDD